GGARRARGALFAGVMWAQLAADEIARRAQSERYGHACEIETSVAMALVPGSVYPERIEPPRPARMPDPLTDPPRARVDQPVAFEEWTENGARGDPRLAAEEIGAAGLAGAPDAALA